jgi:hypothetical protein
MPRQLATHNCFACAHCFSEMPIAQWPLTWRDWLESDLLYRLNKRFFVIFAAGNVSIWPSLVRRMSNSTMVILERMRKILVMEISPKYFNDIIFLWHTKYIEYYRKTCMLFITKKCDCWCAKDIVESPLAMCKWCKYATRASVKTHWLHKRFTYMRCKEKSAE